MVDEKKEQTQEEQFTNMIVSQIETISRLVSQYYTAINPNGKLSGYELTLLGLNCMQAGLILVKSGTDVDKQDVQSRINTFASIKRSINDAIDSTYLNEEIVTKMVANCAAQELENAVKQAEAEEIIKKAE